MWFISFTGGKLVAKGNEAKNITTGFAFRAISVMPRGKLLQVVVSGERLPQQVRAKWRVCVPISADTGATGRERHMAARVATVKLGVRP